LADQVVIRISKTFASEFASMWDEIRSVEGFDAEEMLEKPQEMERFDAATVVEWVVQLTDAVGPILTGVLGYLVAKKGEVEIDGMKFKNISVNDIKKIIEILEKKK
jgi:Mg2+/Co2+ transporter CorC